MRLISLVYTKDARELKKHEKRKKQVENDGFKCIKSGHSLGVSDREEWFLDVMERKESGY